MKRGRITRALVAVGAVVLTSLLLLTATPTAAQAYDGASGSGSGGGGGNSGSWGAITRWNYANSWNELVNAKFMLSNMNSSGAGASNAEEAAQWFVRTSSGGQGLVNLCKGPNLVRIYYLGASGGIPIKPNTASGKFPWGGTGVTGDAPDVYASTLNWTGTYVICVIDPVERITKTEPQSRPMSSAATISGTYSWNKTVTAELNGPDGVDPIGLDNLNDQPVISKVTNFGELVDSVAKTGSGSFDSKHQALEAALMADGTEPHGPVTLNKKNQDGLAEGGVLSVQEHETHVTVALSQKWTESRSRSYTCDYLPGTKGQQLASPANCSYGSWSGWHEDQNSRSHSLAGGTPTQQNTVFWQFLSVHCNPDELAAALASYGSTYSVISQTQKDEKVTTVLRTTPLPSRSNALSSSAILGVPSSSLPAALARTGQVGFYDKHCEVQCLTDPNGAGASTANGAVNNVSTASSRGGTYTNGGAVLGDTNSNYFEVFRDNDRNRISVNTAYPDVAGSALNYSGQAPIATTVTLWNGSTPGTNASSAGGLFSMWAVNGVGEKRLFTGNQNPSEQTNFTLASPAHPVQAFSGEHATKLAGAYRAFDVAGTWASEATAPVVLNVKWEYQPTTQVSVPESVEYLPTGTVNYDVRYRTQKIDVDCYAAFGSSSSAPEGYYAPRDTGSGVVNSVDKAILGTGGASAFTSHENLVIRFVRGVAE